MGKVTQRQIVSEITPVNSPNHTKGPNFTRYFATVSGGEISSSVEKVYDGNSTFPDVLCAPSEIGDITVGMHYDPDKHTNKLNRIRQLVGATYYDVTIFTLNCDLKDPGSERVYAKALLVGLTEPDGDASSGSPSMFTLTFSPSTVGAA